MRSEIPHNFILVHGLSNLGLASVDMVLLRLRVMLEIIFVVIETLSLAQSAREFWL